MKHFNFSVGLVIGAATGTILSLIRFKNGQRLGQPLQDQSQATQNDINNLKKTLNNLQEAKQKLNDALPAGKKTSVELENDFKYYQMKVDRILKNLATSQQKLSRNFSDNKE